MNTSIPEEITIDLENLRKKMEFTEECLILAANGFMVTYDNLKMLRNGEIVLDRERLN